MFRRYMLYIYHCCLSKFILPHLLFIFWAHNYVHTVCVYYALQYTHVSCIHVLFLYLGGQMLVLIQCLNMSDAAVQKGSVNVHLYCNTRFISESAPFTYSIIKCPLWTIKYITHTLSTAYQKEVPAEAEKATSNVSTSFSYDENFHRTQHCHIISWEMNSSPVLLDKP